MVMDDRKMDSLMMVQWDRLIYNDVPIDNQIRKIIFFVAVFIFATEHLRRGIVGR